MRIQYAALLNTSAVNVLKSFPVPEPPSDQEMKQELAGLARLEEALDEPRCESCNDAKPTMTVIDADPAVGYFHEIELCRECWKRRGRKS